ncbi:hypothetical protein HGM15179_015478 [Zosterops borbonicus]|uniref:Ig-like domain-containing protein n=1 Tax=Zosterops borbonicus TaxID=364589 RepID=A0A8K1G4S7_9PASS|nr:hypothetical protein HGM15179_015478 [Zosterops borbonicus]
MTQGPCVPPIQMPRLNATGGLCIWKTLPWPLVDSMNALLLLTPMGQRMQDFNLLSRQKGEKGREEELVTKEPSCPAVYRNSSMLLGQRVLLGLNNALKISPTKITDDGRVFSCHVLYHPERVQKSSTTVRVFAYPEIFISLQEGSASTSQKPNVSCVVRKAFPKPSLLWYMDGASLTEQPGEISVVQEDLQDSEGFYELRSTLVLQGTHETHKTFSCVCLFPSLGNETRIISSEEIFVSFDNKSNEASADVFTTTVSDDISNSTLTSAVMTDSEHQSTSVASLDSTSQANLAPTSTTQGNLSYSTTDQTISVTRREVFFPTSSLLNSTGDGRNTKASHFPWPTAVAVLLLFCSSLVALGIRKWCQYQKEIMNRPPPFKPPPPPIKYTSMVESDGTPPSCHELENL